MVPMHVDLQACLNPLGPAEASCRALQIPTRPQQDLRIDKGSLYLQMANLTGDASLLGVAHDVNGLVSGLSFRPTAAGQTVTYVASE